MAKAHGSASGFFVAAVLAIAALECAYALWSPTVQNRKELAERNARLEAQVRGLWNRSVELEGVRDALMYDPVMIESVARGQMGYRRRGEFVHPPAKDLAVARPSGQAGLADPCALAPISASERSRPLFPPVPDPALPPILLLLAGAVLVAVFANLPVWSHLRRQTASPES